MAAAAQGLLAAEPHLNAAGLRYLVAVGLLGSIASGADFEAGGSLDAELQWSGREAVDGRPDRAKASGPLKGHAHHNASCACTTIWCNAGVASRLAFVMMLANSAWSLARWPSKNRFSPPAI